MYVRIIRLLLLHRFVAGTAAWCEWSLLRGAYHAATSQSLSVRAKLDMMLAAEASKGVVMTCRMVFALFTIRAMLNDWSITNTRPILLAVHMPASDGSVCMVAASPGSVCKQQYKCTILHAV